MQITALLAASPDPTEAEIREALSGNICRCTGYESIVNGCCGPRATTSRATSQTEGASFDHLERRRALYGASVKRSETLASSPGGPLRRRRAPARHAPCRFRAQPFPTPASASRRQRGAPAPGVMLVLTGAELESMIVPGRYRRDVLRRAPVPSFTTLATDKVRLVGDPVVLVVADSRYLAEDACELSRWTTTSCRPWRPRRGPRPEPAGDLRGLGSNVLIHSPATTYGDVDEAFARADRWCGPSCASTAIRTCPWSVAGGVQLRPESGELTVHSACQGVHIARMSCRGRSACPKRRSGSWPATSAARSGSSSARPGRTSPSRRPPANSAGRCAGSRTEPRT